MAMNTPLPTAYLMASSTTGAGAPSRPMLMLMMLAPLSAAYRMPRATTSSVPKFGAPKMSSHSPVDHLDRHDLDVEGDAGHALTVVGQLSDRAADVRAVAVEIERHGVVPDEVVRRDEPADGRELGRKHEIERQVAQRRIEHALIVAKCVRVGTGRRVRVRDARVEDGHSDVRAGRRLDVPGALEVDERQVPLQLLVVRIVWHEGWAQPVRRLRVLDVGALPQRRGHRLRVLARIDADDVEIRI